MKTEISHRDSLIQLYSDYHKDAYGYRPTYNYSLLTTEELEADYDTFGRICEENRIEEAKAEKLAIEKFNETVKKMIKMGAKNTKTALRWICEAGVEEDGWDIDFFLWKMGISKYSSEGSVVYNKLLPFWRKALK